MHQTMAFSLAEPTPAEQASGGSAPTFEAVYGEYFRGVWRTLRRLGVADAQLDDAAQDVFLVVHHQLPRFKAGSLRSWLYAIAVRVASDYRRRAGRRQASPLSESIADERPCPGRNTEMRESVRLLHQILAQLDEQKRTVFVLSELEQLSAPEIAEALGVNLNTIYSRLRAARLAFEECWARQRRSEPEFGVLAP